MSRLKLEDLREKFPQVVTNIDGNSQLHFDKVSSAESATKESLCFVSDHVQFLSALKGDARALVLPKALDVQLPPGYGAVRVSNFTLAHYKFLELLFRPKALVGRIHSTAIIGDNVRLGAHIEIGPYVVLGNNISVGDNCVIGSHAVIEDDCQLGRDCRLGTHVYLGPRTQIGERVKIHPHSTIGGEGFGFAQDDQFHSHRIQQIGNVIIQNDVEIGASVAIDRGSFDSTIIGEGSKLDNLIHIAHNVKIGKHCLLTAGLKIAGSSELGDFVVTGGNVSVTDHVKICSRVRLAGCSGVNNDVTVPGDYGGHPLQPVKNYLKTTMCLPHLPEFRKKLKMLEDQVRDLGIEK